MDELRPCPFCGSKKVVYMHDLEGVPNGIFCGHCKAFVKWPITMNAKETFGEVMARFAEMWNARGIQGIER